MLDLETQTIQLNGDPTISKRILFIARDTVFVTEIFHMQSKCSVITLN